MTTRALLYWVAWIAGAELLARGYLADRVAWFHAGAWLLVAVSALSAWRWRAVHAAAAVFALLALLPAGASLLALARPTSGGADPLAAFWREHAADRAQLLNPSREQRAAGELLVFGERVALDERGFRAAVPPPDGSFRIVAVGDANTFGATLRRDEQPWPALLQQAIDARLRCAVPVRVVNAGVPGRSLAGVLASLEHDLLPLAPDVLVSYPDPAQLVLLARQVPALAVPAPEPLPPRASAALRRIEASLRARRARAAFEAARRAVPAEVDLRQLPLAGAYRRLMVQSRAQGTDVVLAPLALALAPDAPEAEIRRHEAIEPRTRQLLVARDLHSRLLAEIGATYRARWVDLEASGPRAGDADAFLDLWLLSQRGRAQLADAVLETLRPRLAEPHPGCVPRDARGAPAA